MILGSSPGALALFERKSCYFFFSFSLQVSNSVFCKHPLRAQKSPVEVFDPVSHYGEMPLRRKLFTPKLGEDS